MSATSSASARRTPNYRTPRITPRPVIAGPQTAVVVGASGNEIETDKHGRIKVQFHWDRLGKKDQNSSCWVRVAQPWAGKGYGMFSLPRVDDEVVVHFLDGDPDRPLVIGAVYNNDNMMAWKLPEQATVTGFKSRVQQGGRRERHECQRAALRRQEGQGIHLVPRRARFPSPGRARRVRLGRQQRVGQGHADAQGGHRRELVRRRDQGRDAQPRQGPARQRRRRHLLHRRRDLPAQAHQGLQREGRRRRLDRGGGQDHAQGRQHHPRGLERGHPEVGRLDGQPRRRAASTSSAAW